MLHQHPLSRHMQHLPQHLHGYPPKVAKYHFILCKWGSSGIFTVDHSWHCRHDRGMTKVRPSRPSLRLASPEKCDQKQQHPSWPPPVWPSVYPQCDTGSTGWLQQPDRKLGTWIFHPHLISYLSWHFWAARVSRYLVYIMYNCQSVQIYQIPVQAIQTNLPSFQINKSNIDWVGHQQIYTFTVHEETNHCQEDCAA